MAHTLKGLSHQHMQVDLLLPLILRGVGNLQPVRQNKRRVMTFPLLLILGQKIAETSWTPLQKQVIWAASTTAFFASARMGELLAKGEFSHSESDLIWKDVKESSTTSVLIRIKQPKSGSAFEFVDLFSFTGFQCCPVAALRSLKQKQLDAHMDHEDLPVFRFSSGRNLTMPKMNKALKFLFSDLCKDEMDVISCHSFRAGIPSTLSLFPELATDDMIKGWGRWKSDSHMRYTRLKLEQKNKIFDSISKALKATVSD